MTLRLPFQMSAAIVVWMLISAQSLAADAESAIELKALIPEHGTTADVMMPSPRMRELAAKMQAAIAKNPEWWLKHVKSAKPGKSLPYDSRLGFNESEYEEYLELSKKLWEKAEQIVIHVKRDGNKTVLRFGEGALGIEDVELDVKTNSIKTTYGAVAEPTMVTSDSEGSAIFGKWAGFSWEREEENENSSPMNRFRLGIGKLKESGRGVLYYDVRHVRGDSTKSFTLVLQYDLP